MSEWGCGPHHLRKCGGGIIWSPPPHFSEQGCVAMWINCELLEAFLRKKHFAHHFLAPLTIVRRSLSDTNPSGIRRPAAYINFFKLLLLLHFSMDSLETRYTCFLGQSPNILKFGFSDFLWIFIKFSLKSLLPLQFPVVQIATSPTFFNRFFWN